MHGFKRITIVITAHIRVLYASHLQVGALVSGLPILLIARMSLPTTDQLLSNADRQNFLPLKEDMTVV